MSPGGVWADQAQNWGKCNSGQEQCTTIMATEGIYDACLNAYQCVPSGNQPCPTQSSSGPSGCWGEVRVGWVWLVVPNPPPSLLLPPLQRL